MITTWIQAVYQFLWGDLLRIPLPGDSSLVYHCYYFADPPQEFISRSEQDFCRFVFFGDMVRALTGKKKEDDSLSTFQTLIVSTAKKSRNGESGWREVAAVSAGGAGAVFDVDHSDYRFFNRIYRGNACTAL